MKRSLVGRIGFVLLMALLISASGTGPLAIAQGPCGDTVTVSAGDTLTVIAGRCNTTVEAVLEANPQISDRDLIYVGQVSRYRGSRPLRSSLLRRLPGRTWSRPATRWRASLLLLT